jgi:hypothetical protein
VPIFPLGQSIFAMPVAPAQENKMTNSNTRSPSLLTESPAQFASLCAELEEDIQPKGIIERTYVHDIANLILESRCLRRYKTAIINNSRLAALQKILEQLLCHPDYDPDSDFIYVHSRAAEDLARSWFDSKKAQARVASLLRKFGLDEGAIEGEAFRLCSEELERLDRMLTALEFRRERALRCIADYRQIFSKHLQLAANRILEHDDVPRLIAVGKRPD